MLVRIVWRHRRHALKKGGFMEFTKFSKRQVLALSWWNRAGYAQYDAIVCDGAVRSGKTVAMTVGFFIWSMSRFQNQLFALCGRTVGALRRNIVIHLQGWLGELFTVEERRGENCIVITDRAGRRNTYFLFGGQDEAAYMSIQGITLAGVLLDEVVLMSRSFTEQAVARCSVAGSKLWFNCNPGSPQHWFYREWIQKAAEKRALHLHFTMEDNLSLEDGVRQRYERLYTGVFYRRYIRGEWCAAQGRVYEFDEDVHVTEEEPAGRYYISVDYGVQNPFSAGLWSVAGGKAVRLREFYHNGRECGRTMTDEEYADCVEELAGELPVEQVIVDPSAASFIAVLRRRGRFSVRKAKNDVLPGIRLVAQLLKEGRLKVHKSCRAAIREFGLYCWEEGGEDKVRKVDDHAMDEIRYFAMGVMRREWTMDN